METNMPESLPATPGTTLRTKYHGQEFTADVEIDGIHFEGQRYTSLTAVAKEIILRVKGSLTTANGKPVSVNGRAFWGIAPQPGAQTFGGVVNRATKFVAAALPADDPDVVAMRELQDRIRAREDEARKEQDRARAKAAVESARKALDAALERAAVLEQALVTAEARWAEIRDAE